MNKINVSIHGTSNSVRYGWKNALTDNPKLNVINYSIGACCSGSALCSSLHYESYKNDINILELSINDNNWVLRKEITEEHIKKYIDALFDLMVSNDSKVILLILPDKRFVNNFGEESIIAKYYEEKAASFNIPMVNGYEYVEKLFNDIDIDRLFFDRLHLFDDIAFNLGRLINDLVEYLYLQDEDRVTIHTENNGIFRYMPATDLAKNKKDLKQHGTRLRTEVAITLDRADEIKVQSPEKLCGLFIDANNSKAIMQICGEENITVNTYRSETKTNKTQFYYLPIKNTLNGTGEFNFKVVDTNTPINQKSLTDRKIETDDNSVVIFGMLFLHEQITKKKYRIPNDESYSNCNDFIQTKLNRTCNEIKEINSSIRKNIYIHIGMHKTGSSSIQQSLFSNLMDDDFFYIPLNGANHSGAVQFLFRDNASEILTAQINKISHKEAEKKRERIKEKLLQDIQGAKQKNLIVSGEGIIHLDLNELTNLKRFFESHLFRIHIIGYVRPPASYMVSAFQQRLKMNFVHSDLESISPSYEWRLNKFDEVFGKQNVTLWKYDPKAFPGGDVVLDFCHKLGISFNPRKVIRVNESLSQEAIALLYIYRKFGPEYGMGRSALAENDFVIEKLRAIGNTKLMFSPKILTSRLEKNESDIRWMEKRLGVSLEEKFNENGGIANENQLLQIALDNVKAVKGIVDPHYLPKDIPGETPEEVALIVHCLRKEAAAKLKNNLSTEKGNMRTLPVSNIVEKLKVNHPSIDDKDIRKLVRSLILRLKEEIVSNDGKVVNIPLLGTFRKKEIAKSGEKIIRFIFIPHSDD